MTNWAVAPIVETLIKYAAAGFALTAAIGLLAVCTDIVLWWLSRRAR